MSDARGVYVEHVMGMPISIHVRGPQAAGPAAHAAADAVFAELRRADALFSTYRPESEVSRIRAGNLPLADASPEVVAVADLCDQAHRLTNGAFDAWLRDAHGRPRFDPTGLVKGHAVERAARHLRALADHDHYVNAAGDVLVSCGRPASAAWRIGIESPLERQSLVAVVELCNGGVATSGTAARGGHIVDPTTGAAASAIAAVTVAGPSLTWADVYATAAFVRGAEAIAFLERVPGYEGLVAGRDGSTGATSGWGRAA